jgi:hypothetical protein
MDNNTLVYVVIPKNIIRYNIIRESWRTQVDIIGERKL